MIESLTRQYQFTCDRCGKKILFDEPSTEKGVPRDIVFYHVVFVGSLNNKAGQVCSECHQDFSEIAENFFDESNREECVV